MITHEVPGDSFWDLIRKGAETAAREGQHRTALFGTIRKRPTRPTSCSPQSTPRWPASRSRWPSRTRWPLLSPPPRQQESRWWRSTPGSTTSSSRASRSTSARTRGWRASRPGKRLTQDGAKKALCVIQEQGQVALEARCAGVTEGFTGGTTEILNVNSKDMPSVESTITRQAAAGSQHRPRRHARCADRADRGAVRRQRGQQGQDRHLRHQRRAGQRDQVR